MKIVYVSGPISHRDIWGRFQNICKGLEVARDINALGVPLKALCPHGDTFLMDGEDIPYEKFLEGDLELLRRLDGIVMMPAWRDSKGARREWEAANALGLPVFYWPFDRPALMRWAAGEVGLHDLDRAGWPAISSYMDHITTGPVS